MDPPRCEAEEPASGTDRVGAGGGHTPETSRVSQRRGAGSTGGLAWHCRSRGVGAAGMAEDVEAGLRCLLWVGLQGALQMGRLQRGGARVHGPPGPGAFRACAFRGLQSPGHGGRGGSAGPATQFSGTARGHRWVHLCSFSHLPHSPKSPARFLGLCQSRCPTEAGLRADPNPLS